jgi:hypothetical protein
MAKRRRKAAPVLAAAAEALPCRLRSIDDSPDFEAVTGETVNVFTHDQVGVVLIAKAEYGGLQLVPPGQAVSTIEFKVLPNRHTLKLVFVFSASTMGRGELREQCGDDGDSQFLRAIVGTEPFQFMAIFGAQS